MNANNCASRFAAKQFAADFAYMLAMADKRKAENAAARARMQADAELCTVLLTEAQRRGQVAIDWAEYFRNCDV